MIDHSTRIERIAQEARDPSTAVIVLDVVLGFAAHDDPAGALAPAIAHAKAACASDGRHLSVVAFVCGTEEDPQRLSVQQAKLREAGALVLPGSTAAARLAGEIGRLAASHPAKRCRARAADMTRPRRIVIAFGGNASYPPTIKGLASEQLALMAQACRHLVRIIQSGYQLVLTHGNGPVVGNILFRMAKTASELPPMPMDVCVAHSQGGMGYMLQQTLVNVLREEGVAMAVSGIITQVEVNANDPGFSNPDQTGRTLLRPRGRRPPRARARLAFRRGCGPRLSASRSVAGAGAHRRNSGRRSAAGRERDPDRLSAAAASRSRATPTANCTGSRR